MDWVRGTNLIHHFDDDNLKTDVLVRITFNDKVSIVQLQSHLHTHTALTTALKTLYYSQCLYMVDCFRFVLYL